MVSFFPGASSFFPQNNFNAFGGGGISNFNGFGGFNNQGGFGSFGGFGGFNNQGGFGGFNNVGGQNAFPGFQGFTPMSQLGGPQGIPYLLQIGPGANQVRSPFGTFTGSVSPFGGYAYADFLGERVGGPFGGMFNTAIRVSPVTNAIVGMAGAPTRVNYNYGFFMA